MQSVCVTRIERALTMVELLVCLGVLAVALGSVLSIFIAGTRFGATARRRMDASRVARAVYGLFERGWEEPPPGSDNWHGRDGDGKVVDETIQSEQLPSISNVPLGWAPAYVVDSPIPLVWKCGISAPPAGTFDIDGMYNVEITVSLDEDENVAFDATDEVIGRWYAVLADR